MKHWSRNDKFAFIGVILAVIAVASGLFGQEIRRGMGLDQASAANQVSVGGSNPAPGLTPPPVPVTPAGQASEMVIQVKGDVNTITFNPSPVVNPETIYQLGGDNGTSDFLVGPKQTARIELLGDENTVRVAAKLKDRVTIVNNGDGNKVID